MPFAPRSARPARETHRVPPARPPRPGRAVTWASSAEGVARVDAGGVVTGVAPGTAVVTATSEGRSGQATVVVRSVPVATVTVAPASQTIAVGDVVTLAATARDDQGATLAGREARWTSSTPGVASVDAASGQVRGVSAGTATITATSEERSGTATVTVTAPAGGAIAASEVSVAGIGTGAGAHTCAISADRLTVWCWGLNDAGQLGNGAVTPDGVANPAPSVVQGQRPLPPAR